MEVKDGAVGANDSADATCHWSRYPINFSTINSTTDEVLKLNSIQNSSSANSRRLMLTTPVSLPTPSNANSINNNSKSSNATQNGEAENAASGVSTKKVVCLIDMKRAQNAAISLARIKISFANLRTKIEALDDENLTVDQLIALREYLPNTDEVRTLSLYVNSRKPVSSLGPAERYMVAMLGLQDGVKRISCMIFKVQFPTQVHACKSQLCLLETGLENIQT